MTSSFFLKVTFTLASMFVVFSSVNGHAYLSYPNHRDGNYERFFSCAPRGNFSAIYDQEYDPALWKCGVCGNLITEATPRSNEYGGLYWQHFGGAKSAFVQGWKVRVRFYIADPHFGEVVLHICDNSALEIDNQDCFNQNPLRLEGEDGDYWSVENTSVKITTQIWPGYTFGIAVWAKLPENLTCENCTMQLHYRAGKSVNSSRCITGDVAPDGIHCRQQETFRDCSDIRILPEQSSIELLSSVPRWKDSKDNCVSQTEETKSDGKFRITPCNAADKEQLQRVSALPRWNKMGETNLFMIEFVGTALCVQANDRLWYKRYGTVTRNQCSFEKSQKFIPIWIAGSSKFLIKSVSTENCFKLGGWNWGEDRLLAQDRCDENSEAQQFELKIENVKKDIPRET